jgi:hypothetical protein
VGATLVASPRLFRHGQASADSVPSIEPPQSQIFYIGQAAIALQAAVNQHLLLHRQHRLYLGDVEISKLIVCSSKLNAFAILQPVARVLRYGQLHNQLTVVVNQASAKGREIGLQQAHRN